MFGIDSMISSLGGIFTNFMNNNTQTDMNQSNIAAQQKMNEENKKWTQQQNAIDRQNFLADRAHQEAFESPAAIMQRAVEAGINPNLFAGDISAGNTVVGSPAAHSWTGDAPQSQMMAPYQNPFSHFSGSDSIVSSAINLEQYRRIKKENDLMDEFGRDERVTRLEGMQIKNRYDMVQYRRSLIALKEEDLLSQYKSTETRMFEANRSLQEYKTDWLKFEANLAEQKRRNLLSEKEFAQRKIEFAQEIALKAKALAQEDKHFQQELKQEGIHFKRQFGDSNDDNTSIWYYDTHFDFTNIKSWGDLLKNLGEMLPKILYLLGGNAAKGTNIKVKGKK